MNHQLCGKFIVATVKTLPQSTTFVTPTSCSRRVGKSSVSIALSLKVTRSLRFELGPTFGNSVQQSTVETCQCEKSPIKNPKTKSLIAKVRRISLGQFSPFQQKGKEPKAKDTSSHFGSTQTSTVMTHDCWLNMHSLRIFTQAKRRSRCGATCGGTACRGGGAGDLSEMTQLPETPVTAQKMTKANAPKWQLWWTRWNW